MYEINTWIGENWTASLQYFQQQHHDVAWYVGMGYFLTSHAMYITDVGTFLLQHNTLYDYDYDYNQKLISNSFFLPSLQRTFVR